MAGSGLFAQLGFAAESTYGTAPAIDHFAEFLSESLRADLTFLDTAGLRPGIKHKRVTRTVQSRRAAGGDIQLEHASRGMGLLWKMALGSGVVTPAAVTAGVSYRQIHTPGDFDGKSLTIQVGRPEASTGTVKPFTYVGCKCTGWEFSVSDNEYAKLGLTFDARDELTLATTPASPALAAISFSQMEIFHFGQVVAGNFQIGGTVTTTSGLASQTGGTNVASIVRGITVSGETPMASERFGLGNAGLKAEPKENDIPTITGTLNAEFSTQAELYDLYRSNATTPLRIRFDGSTIAGSPEKNTLEILLPAVKFKSAGANVDGPDILGQEVGFEAYSDGVNAPIQVMLITPESTL